jgi:hypothetical protein
MFRSRRTEPVAAARPRSILAARARTSRRPLPRWDQGSASPRPIHSHRSPWYPLRQLPAVMLLSQAHDREAAAPRGTDLLIALHRRCRAMVTGSMFSGPAGAVWSAPVRVRNPNSVITTGFAGGEQPLQRGQVTVLDRLAPVVVDVDQVEHRRPVSLDGAASPVPGKRSGMTRVCGGSGCGARFHPDQPDSSGAVTSAARRQREHPRDIPGECRIQGGAPPGAQPIRPAAAY